MAAANEQTPASWQDQFRDARDHTPVLPWHYTVKGWLRRSETSVLYGPSNSGKSALVGHLGHCIVSGKPFFGARVRKGIVVHVAAESPASVLDRMQAYDIRNVAAAAYFVSTGAVDLSNSSAVETFLRNLKSIIRDMAQEIVLIVIDTLARSVGATDENSAAAMTEIAQTVERIALEIDTHVMLVHHTGKDVDRGSRGSSALRGAVDTEIFLQPRDGGAVALIQDKQRTMPKSASVQFALETHVLGEDEDGEDRTTVRAVELQGEPEEAGKDKRRKTGLDRRTAVLTALHVLRLSLGAGKPITTQELLASIPPEVFAGVAEANRPRTLTRILEDLANAASPLIEGGKGTWRLCAAKGS